MPPFETPVEAFSMAAPRASVIAESQIRQSSVRDRDEYERQNGRSEGYTMTMRNSSGNRPSQIKSRVQPLTLVFKELTFIVPLGRKHGRLAREKIILDKLSGIFRPGRLTAIMGPSGAGKTSLLDCLAGNLLGGQISGQVLVNNEDYSGKKIKAISGFVFQDDVMLETMTVREAIKQSAILRLPKSVSKEERKNRVEDIIRLLHLESCQNTKIGSTNKKGISGGERKRCATAMELIANPPMLFLDEPTSGLDTFTAYTVVKSLSRLAHQGRTVIATIHQPSSQIFHLFDDLILLNEGHIVYCGDVQASIDYFARLGYPCPQYSNPADFYFMDVLRQFNVPGYSREALLRESINFQGVDYEGDKGNDVSGNQCQANDDEHSAFDSSRSSNSNATAPAITDAAITTTSHQEEHEQDNRETVPEVESEDSIRERVNRLQFAWLESDENRKLQLEMETSSKEGVAIGTLRKKASFWIQFTFLLGRASKNALRNPLMLFVAMFRAIFLGLLVGLIFLNSGQYNVQGQIRNKSGAIFFLALNTFFSSCFSVLTIFYAEKQVFFREYKAGYYTTTPYFFSKFLVELPYAFIFPYLTVIIAYYMIGLNPPFSDYLFSATFVAVASISGVAIGVLIASIFNDIQVILAITPAVLLPLLLLSGIFVAGSSVPAFLIWIKYISPLYYTTVGMMQIEFSRDFPNCQVTAQQRCDGNYAFQTLGITKSLPEGVNLVLGFTIWAALVMSAYIVLATLTRLKYSSS